MKNENLPTIMWMSVKEIEQNVNFDKANRTAYLDEEENAKNGYNSQDYKVLKSRVKKYGRKCFDDGNTEWNKCIPMIIHYVKEDGKKYISDGQGRFLSVKLMIEEGKCDPDLKLPVMLVECNTIAEMRSDMIAMNTNNKNWSAGDVIRSQAVSLGGDSIIINERLKKVQDRLRLSGLTIPKCIVFGDAGSKKDEIPTSLSETNCYYEIETYFFEKFYNYFERERGCSDRLKRALKKETTGITFHSIFVNIMRVCDGDEKLFRRVIDKMFSVLFGKFDVTNDLELVRVFAPSNKLENKLSICKYIKKLTKINQVTSAMNRMIGASEGVVNNAA